MIPRILPRPPAPGNAGGLIDHARVYNARGLSIIPTIGKEPVGRWKSYQERRADDATLRKMFAKPGITGLAVICGQVSGGLTIRDFDAADAYDRWAGANPILARTLPTVQTVRGFHVYFGSTLDRIRKFDDGELRGAGYCLLPPARHPSGKIYCWSVPLPDGELPVVDPFHAGLCNREDREDGEYRESAVDTDDGGDGENRENTANPALLAPALSTAPTPSSLLQAGEKAIVATLPTCEGQRHRCIFRLARHLKSIQSLYCAEFGTLRPIVEQWHQRAIPVIGTKPFLDTWADFVQAWKRVRVPAGEDPINTAFQRAVASSPPETVTKLYGAGPIALLAAFCRELQRIVGDAEFYLDCRTAGRLLGVEHTTAGRYLDVLCADGILSPGAKGSMATHKSSRFRFVSTDLSTDQ